MKLLTAVASAMILGVRAEDEMVRVATDANWKEVVEKEELILVEFYAPWCGHCKDLAPKFEEAAKILAENDPPIPLAKVDATVEKAQSGSAGVSGYPTLKVYRNGVISDYNGGRDTDSIVSYMKEQTGPSSNEITDSAEAKTKFNKKTLDHVAVVGYFASESLDYKIFMQVADHYRGKFAFYHVKSQNVLEGLGYYGSKSAITIYRPFDKKGFKKMYKGGIFKQAVTEWVLDMALPAVGFADSTAMELLSSKNKPILRAFVAPEKREDLEAELVKELSPIQKKHEKKLLFAINDEGYDAYGMDASDVANGKAFVIEESKKRFVYTKEQGTVAEWVDKWSTKQAEQWTKSEKPAPKAAADEVQVVVGRTFSEIVMDTTKDVLLEVYAPWCGHCKSLEPKYNELAKLFEDNSNIVIAKIDGTANDIAHKKYQASGFPTLLFAPSNAKDSPIAYEGAREAADMEKWIKEHATVKLNEEL